MRHRTKAGALALAVLSSTAAADDRAPAPPVAPSAQAPPVAAEKIPPAPSPSTPTTQAITLQVAPTPPPVDPVKPQTITLAIQAPPVAPPPPQAFTLQVVPAAATPVAVPEAAKPTVPARVYYPGPIRRGIGNLGEWLITAKHARIYVPIVDAQVQPVAAMRVMQPTAAVQLVQPAPVQAAEVMPVLASPQAARKSWFHLSR